MTIDGGICLLRPWNEGDVETLAAIANDWEVARYLHDHFPHPYTVADARRWIEFNRSRPPGNYYAIEVDGRLAGGISVEQFDRERPDTMRLGYWLGRECFGRGIATAACRALTEHAFATTRVHRIEAGVFHPNLASARVLEKAGYVLEETVKNGATRGEQTYDRHLYAKVRE